MTTDGVRLLAVGTSLPGAPVDNAMLARHFGQDAVWEQWIEAFIGTDTRHLAIDLDSGGLLYTLADLAETAGLRALEAANLGPGDIDVVVMGTATPDALMPATVNMVADRLGIDGVPTYQLQSGCTGAFQALDVARNTLLAGHRNALVLGGDVCTRIFGADTDLTALAPEELVNIVLFGDGAGAAVLTTEDRPGAPILHPVSTRLVGLGRTPGQVLEWFTKHERGDDRPPVTEDYKRIEELVPELAEDMLAAIVDDLGWKREELDYLLPPQLSGRMTRRITDRLGVPSATEVSCVSETGNTSNSLPFLQIERLLPRLRAGERAVAVAVESSKWIRAGLALEGV
ncbi:3-oxoacyl-ACP synthase III family protein [Nocardiopsis exhalans]|uniref:3-oxoacyl-ACP synthase III family protein n=1 Tax=Nocardiopsis exhalans TaxID=163604 RepID=A0ABY5D4H8_9ACTN|nr:3-oxoacyl-ACP synthase III family protein [Nocardiopsis exhalans]USY18423.1 3-oxoacyl-ACP synthase III family protein [Nocardiopsis exhalans]